MAKNHAKVDKWHKVFISDMRISSKVSKLRHFCACLMVFCYSVWISSSLVAADKHTYGSTDLNGEVMLNRRIFMRNTSVPTNYTIMYKYVRNKLAGLISYIEIDVRHCASDGKVNMLLDEGVRQETVVTANVRVINCANLNVSAQILGHGASTSSQLFTDPSLAEIMGDKLFDDKSFALIYAHNDSRTMDRVFKIGQRQTNDTLLKNEKITVKNEFDSFPQQEIEFNDANTFITQIEMKFNSATATAFLNSSFIHPNSFNAIAYDLSRPEFTVNVNVFGYYANDKPSHYKSILTF